MQGGECIAMHSWHTEAGKIPAGTKGLLLCALQSGTLAFCFKRQQKSPTLPFKLSGAGLPSHQRGESKPCSALPGSCSSFLHLLAPHVKPEMLPGSREENPHLLKKYSCVNASLGGLGFPWGPLSSFFSHTLTLCPLSGKFGKGEASCRQETGVQLCFKDSFCRSKEMASN